MKQSTHEKKVFQDFDQDLADIKQAVEENLLSLIDMKSAAPLRLSDAVRHALLAPSKRLRPIILYLIAGPDEGLKKAVLSVGSAVEMVHTSSLILDDLPCMDDAETRRSRPTTHMVFGQSTAILSAIAMLTRAFGIISELEDIPSDTRNKLTAILSSAVGLDGLAAGQELDLNGQSGVVNGNDIEKLSWLKTGVLFVAAAEMGAILRDAEEQQIAATRSYATHFGLAFQALDDFLDQSASSAELGKDTNKDAEKTTLIKLYGANKTRQTCLRHLEIADEALLNSGAMVEPLRRLTSRLFSKAWASVE